MGDCVPLARSAAAAAGPGALQLKPSLGTALEQFTYCVASTAPEDVEHVRGGRLVGHVVAVVLAARDEDRV